MGRLQDKRLFLLDMDGTIYLGESLFPFTKGFLRRVEETGRDFCFFTNNSSKNREAYLEKLARMGISLPPEKMLISNGVILQWLGPAPPRGPVLRGGHARPAGGLPQGRLRPGRGGRGRGRPGL